MQLYIKLKQAGKRRLVLEKQAIEKLELGLKLYQSIEDDY
jgi:hypothetical protein